MSDLGIEKQWHAVGLIAKILFRRNEIHEDAYSAVISIIGSMMSTIQNKGLVNFSQVP